MRKYLIAGRRASRRSYVCLSSANEVLPKVKPASTRTPGCSPLTHAIFSAQAAFGLSKKQARIKRESIFLIFFETFSLPRRLNPLASFLGPVPLWLVLA